MHLSTIIKTTLSILVVVVSFGNVIEAAPIKTRSILNAADHAMTLDELLSQAKAVINAHTSVDETASISSRSRLRQRDLPFSGIIPSPTPTTSASTSPASFNGTASIADFVFGKLTSLQDIINQYFQIIFGKTLPISTILASQGISYSVLGFISLCVPRLYVIKPWVKTHKIPKQHQIRYN